MYTLLLIEDQPLIQKTVEIKLKKEGFNVITCNDGKQGLDKIAEMVPDIVLTDIMLPYASGLEIVKAVKARHGNKVPIIVFSTMGQEDIVAEAFDLGADDYITKPFSLAELTIRIKKQLKN